VWFEGSCEALQGKEPLQRLLQAGQEEEKAGTDEDGLGGLEAGDGNHVHRLHAVLSEDGFLNAGRSARLVLQKHVDD